MLVGGIGEINFGKQYRQGNRVYDANHIAMCLTAQPVGNAGDIVIYMQLRTLFLLVSNINAQNMQNRSVKIMKLALSKNADVI